MNNIKELENKILSNDFDEYTLDEYRAAIRKYQRKIDIDKAIYWLQTQNLIRGRTGFINDFKKAMEE